MNCSKVADLTSEYIDDCLSHTLRIEYEAHIGQCPSCAAELESMESMLSTLSGLSGKKSPVDCWPRVRESIVQRKTRQPSWTRWLLRPVVAAPAFAMASLVAVILAWPVQIAQPLRQDSAAVAEYKHYLTAHSRLQRQQAFADPDVTFVAAELEKASVSAASIRP